MSKLNSIFFVLLLLIFVVGCTPSNNESIKLRGLFNQISSFPESPTPTNFLLKTKDKNIYLNISNLDFSDDNTFVVVIGYYITKNVFEVKSIELDQQNPYVKDKYYCTDNIDCFGSIKGEKFGEVICNVTECVNEYSTTRAYSSNKCNYRDQKSYEWKSHKCECIDKKCVLLSS